MSIEAVTTAFNELFATDAMKAVTPKAYAHEILESSEEDLEKYFVNQKIKFIVFNVSKSIERRNFGSEVENYQVEIKYFIEHEEASTGENQQAIKQGLENIYSGVKAELGGNWNGTVDYWNVQSLQQQLERTSLAGKEAWLGKLILNGIRTIC